MRKAMTYFSILLCTILIFIINCSSGEIESTGNNNQNNYQANANTNNSQTNTNKNSININNTNTNDNTNLLTLEDVVHGIAEVYCDVWYECWGPFVSNVSFPSPSQIINDCHSYFYAAWAEFDLLIWKQAIDNQTLVYRPEYANTFSSELMEGRCSILYHNGWPLSFKKMLESKLSLGDECTLSVECPEGYFCDLMNNTCPGQCVAVYKEGEECRPRKDESCERGLRCDWHTDIDKWFCEPRLKQGDSCESSVDCHVPFACGPDRTCTHNQDLLTASENETCWENGIYCKKGLHCAWTDLLKQRLYVYTCVPSAGSQESCYNQAYPEMCPKDEYCKELDTFNGICTKRRKLGEACLGNQCELGNYCDKYKTPSQCTKRKHIGESCEVYTECYSFNCENNICNLPNTCFDET